MSSSFLAPRSVVRSPVEAFKNCDFYLLGLREVRSPELSQAALREEVKNAVSFMR